VLSVQKNKNAGFRTRTNSGFEPQIIQKLPDRNFIFALLLLKPGPDWACPALPIENSNFTNVQFRSPASHAFDPMVWKKSNKERPGKIAPR